jgi:hypothetical protein
LIDVHQLIQKNFMLFQSVNKFFDLKDQFLIHHIDHKFECYEFGRKLSWSIEVKPLRYIEFI